MPRPVNKSTKEFLSRATEFWNEVANISPEVVEEFLSSYVPPAIEGGECQVCFVHVIENLMGHQDWHKTLSFAFYVLGSYIDAVASKT